MSDPLHSDSSFLRLPTGDRREFFKNAACALCGVAALGTPIAATLYVALEPLRTSGRGLRLKLAALTDLPDDGTPVMVQVVAENEDAWTRGAPRAVGSVFLSKTGPSSVRALHAGCPHFGCAVYWVPEKKLYQCPCHDSSFHPDGGLVREDMASPRGLDELLVEITTGEVWVTYQNFKPNQKTKEIA
jgi:menaquinol-cytochrome c reductase iron-sulfur subunit